MMMSDRLEKFGQSVKRHFQAVEENLPLHAVGLVAFGGGIVVGFSEMAHNADIHSSAAWASLALMVGGVAIAEKTYDTRNIIESPEPSQESLIEGDTSDNIG